MTRYIFTVNNKTTKFYRLKPLLARVNVAFTCIFGSLRNPYAIAIILVTEAEMRSLKKRYHGKNIVTDVLSFPTIDGLYRGEIIVCPPYLEKQACKSKEKISVLLSHTITHGILHLEGHHHEGSARAEQTCLRLEEKILALLGIEHLHET